MKRITLTQYEGTIPRCKEQWSRSASDYKNEINRRYKKLSQEEMNAVLNKAKSSEKERQECIELIIDSLGPLIMRLALQFSKENNYMDYVQEAAMTIIDCVEKYDTEHESGSSFITYCVTSIVSKFNHKGSELDGVITYSSVTESERSKIRSFKEKYIITNGVPPSKYDIEEECKRIGIPYSDSYFIYGSPIKSIDMVDDEEDTSFYTKTPMDYINEMEPDKNFVPDSWSDSYDYEKIFQEIRNRYSEFAKNNKKMPEDSALRNIEMLFEYYGVGVPIPLSINELSRKYKISEQRVRVILEQTPEYIRKLVSDKDL